MTEAGGWGCDGCAAGGAEAGEAAGGGVADELAHPAGNKADAASTAPHNTPVTMGLIT